ncbi:MAG: DUF1667 domain-containing protein [Treponema sp.]|nr:DUF1667 domain-containing protein [Treponema sp.]
MKEMTCIVCPIGCNITVEEDADGGADSNGQLLLTITGNSCNRGAAYAREEILSPKRAVTATCGFMGADNQTRGLSALRRIPVKSSAPCPKGKISELLGDIYRLNPSLPVRAGDKLLTDWKGIGIDVVAVRDVLS